MSFLNSALQQRQNLGLRPNPPGAAAPGPALLWANFSLDWFIATGSKAKTALQP
jgi:hypothetical protein